MVGYHCVRCNHWIHAISDCYKCGTKDLPALDTNPIDEQMARLFNPLPRTIYPIVPGLPHLEEYRNNRRGNPFGTPKTPQSFQMNSVMAELPPPPTPGPITKTAAKLPGGPQKHPGVIEVKRKPRHKSGMLARITAQNALVGKDTPTTVAELIKTFGKIDKSEAKTGGDSAGMGDDSESQGKKDKEAIDDHE